MGRHFFYPDSDYYNFSYRESGVNETQKIPAAENFLKMSKNSLKGKNSPDSDYYIFA